MNLGVEPGKTTTYFVNFPENSSASRGKELHQSCRELLLFK